MQLQGELREHASEPRVHPLELISPPTYEEAVTMQRLARSLDALDSVQRDPNVGGMTASSESLRTGGKKRRPRRRLRSQSEDNLQSRREVRREERLRRVREEGRVTNSGGEEEETRSINKSSNRQRLPTPTAARRKSVRRLSQKTGTSTDDEDSDVERRGSETRKIGRTVIRNLEREPRSGYKPSDGDS